METGFTTGRRKIFTGVDKITKDNVIEVVENALLTHNQNVQEIEWLFQLYRGSDAVIKERKRTGPNEEVNYKAFVSYYSLIADYAANLFMQNPTVFVNADGEEEVSEELIKLGKIHRDINKYARDKETALHAAICGVGYRFIEQDRKRIIKDSVISPRNTFSMYGDDTDDQSEAMVYLTTELDSEPSLAKNEIIDQTLLNDQNLQRRTVYTDEYVYTWLAGDTEVKVTEAQPWGCPIVEYRLNPFYIGSFERVTTLIHLMSVLRSDGVNGVVQSVAGFIFGKNIGLPMLSEDDTEGERREKLKVVDQFRSDLKKYRQMFVEDGKESIASIDYIETELFNSDIDILYEGLKDDIITITRTPNSVMNMGASGKTGAASIASGGDQAIDNAKSAEPFWFESLRDQTRIELKILEYMKEPLKLSTGDIDFAMQRSVRVDITQATQAFANLTREGVTIADAAEIAGITEDPMSFEKRTLDNIKRIREEEAEYERQEREAGATVEEIVVEE